MWGTQPATSKNKIKQMKRIRQLLPSRRKKLHKKENVGTSLVVQWVRVRAPDAGGPGSIPGQGTRSHMPQLRSPHATTKDPVCRSEDSTCHK